MSKEKWDERYSEEGYAYGKEPNDFFKKEIEKLKPGKLLLPADGEGRNAVYAASLGWDVTAVDISTEGKKKALLLADEKGVSINYIVSPLEEFYPEADYYDAIALIYTHFSPDVRDSFYNKFASALKPGGKLIVEIFSTEQLNYSSGGPKDIELLGSEEILKKGFSSLSEIKVWEEIINLNEGKYHIGEAAVVRLIGIK